MDETGLSVRETAKALRKARALDSTFGAGEVLGSMCTEPHEVARLAHDLFLETNLGDPAHFPGAATLEREVLADLLQLTNAPPGAGARYLTGGTEANLLASFLAREATKARQIVISDAGHFSFDKAARLLEMELVMVPTLESGHADVKAMGKAISRKTALVVGIAGTTEVGLIDPIAELAAVCAKRDVRLHVDAAFGGYVIPFLEAAGRLPHVTDFRLPGVWSIALDPHKMGMATIPGGALVLRDERDWDRIAVRSPYVSTTHQSTLMGTRPGAAVAATWAVHRHLGLDGFAGVVETCLDNATFLAAELQRLGIDLVAPPELNVVAFKAEEPRDLAERLASKGFRLNVLPRLGALRVVVGPHVTRKRVGELVEALREVTA